MILNDVSLRRRWFAAALCMTCVAAALPATAQSAFEQSLAQLAATDPAMQAFYGASGYQPIWTGGGSLDRQRIGALVQALDAAADHGLPALAHDIAELETQAAAARDSVALAQLELAFSRTFLAYADDIQSGVLNPARTDPGILRTAPRRDPVQTLTAFATGVPEAVLAALPPQTEGYRRLLEEKARLEQLLDGPGWGPKVAATALAQGQSDAAVLDLRNRLAAMGYAPGDGQVFDAALTQAVIRFQSDHGLSPDGVAGKGTLAEVNKDPADRLTQVLIGLERERWMNFPLGDRHVWVNLPDFTARIVDDNRVTFETRSVIGLAEAAHQSPEFSDMMEYIVVNPTWNVPRSITVNEYLPMLKADPNAVSHLQLLDEGGRVVSRAEVNFAAFDAGNFPYRLKEPPSEANALGSVKFMFPNPYNIYLHDTPSKALFARETRAYSHGCIRLGDPHDFAHALLERQTGNAQGVFAAVLDSRRENTIKLDVPVPVHLVYNTAYRGEDGRMQYRRDVYGRDKAVWAALQKAGVSLRAVRG